MFSVWTEWADITRRGVYEAVPYHLVLPLEALSTLASWTCSNRAVVGSALGMDICV